MAQGTRGRWIRVAATGFGMVLCTGLVGCMNWDKPKDSKAAKQPAPGLPGTPQLPNNGAAANTKTGQPYTGQPYGGPGANIQPAGGFATSGAGGGRVGTTGLNTNTSPPQQFNFGSAQPNYTGGIGSPTSPGVNVQPAGGIGGPVGAAPIQNTGAVAYSSPSPPPPALLDPPLPPATGAAGRSEFGSGPIQPPTPPGPIQPSLTPPGAGPTYTGKGNF